ncbi:MAG TPA: transketolase, partial [Gaiellaceae bacterium]|nr:transketolase [Gaiellaceae bacterium]
VIDLAQRAHAIRRTVIRMCMGRGQGYAGQGLALAELMACLYFDELRRDRDHLVLSTGHSAIALFAGLRELGIYELAELETYGMDGSRIEESPLEGTPGFEITGGSLGQGLSQAVGLALGERLLGRDGRVYCLLSDGELQEGQVWEAAMSAGHYRLDNLVALIDDNRMQADGATAEVMTVEPIVDKFAAFGFAARRIDANDLEQIRAAFAWARSERGRPAALVCETLPGKGVPSFEVYEKVHYIRAEPAVWERALAELDAPSG